MSGNQQLFRAIQDRALQIHRNESNDSRDSMTEIFSDSVRRVVQNNIASGGMTPTSEMRLDVTSDFIVKAAREGYTKAEINAFLVSIQPKESDDDEDDFQVGYTEFLDD